MDGKKRQSHVQRDLSDGTRIDSSVLVHRGECREESTLESEGDGMEHVKCQILDTEQQTETDIEENPMENINFWSNHLEFSLFDQSQMKCAQNRIN